MDNWADAISSVSLHPCKCKVSLTFNILKMIMLGHLEETDNQYYNYDNSEFEDKKVATEHLCSNVLIFETRKKNKKTAENLEKSRISAI